MPTSFADILLPLPLADKYTYAIPADLEQDCRPGTRVLVQFGAKKIYTGIIFTIHQEKPTDFEVKDILEVLDPFPMVNALQLRLWMWSADYYMNPPGDFYKAALPAGLRVESETKIIPNLEFHALNTLSETARQAYLALENQNTMTVAELQKLTAPQNPVRIIKELLDKKAASVQEHLRKSYQVKTEKRVRLHPQIQTEEALHQALDQLSKARKQKELLQYFIRQRQDKLFSKEGLLKSTFLKETEASAASLKSLFEKEYLEEYTEDISRLKKDHFILQEPHPLNEKQQQALDQIQEEFQQKETVLLHGVTSSGKTEIYIHLIQSMLEQGKQVLYLLPEIALTSQIVSRLQKVFGDQVGVYHSKFSDAERVEIYKNLRDQEENSYKIILGVRSSVFLPYHNLGLIIVDEEHENTYKQFDPSPRYNARDLAVVMALMHKGKVLLGSATPSLESYFNAKTGRYGLVELLERFKNVQLPAIEIADTLRARKKKQMVSHFSPQLIQQMDEALSRKEQVILFQNRRGFSPYIECNSCGWVPKCKACDVSLTYHKGIDKLVCHYCGYSTPNTHHCPQCRQADISTKGFGTEKVEDEISLIFKDARVGRLDLDTAKGKNGHEQVIKAFQSQALDILIGTQMVSKGLDFDHVKVVGILNADSMLGFPDFRAFERSYQLMAQVSGRAGRRDTQGTVVIQTYDPEHRIIQQVKNNRYDLMFAQQLEERKTYHYPPFTRLIKIIFKHRDKQVVKQAAKTYVQSLAQLPKALVLGPTTPAIMRVQNLYIQHILIKLSRTQDLSDTKKTIRKNAVALKTQAPFKSLQIIFDVDPM